MFFWKRNFFVISHTGQGIMRIKPDCLVLLHHSCSWRFDLISKMIQFLKNDSLATRRFGQKWWCMHVHCFEIMNHFFHSPWLNQHFPLTQRLHVWNNSQQIDHTNQVSQPQEGQSWWWNNTRFFLLQRLSEFKVLYKGEDFRFQDGFENSRLFCYVSWHHDSVGWVLKPWLSQTNVSGMESPLKNESWRFGLVLRW